MSDSAKKPRLSFEDVEIFFECLICMCTFPQNTPIFQRENGHMLCSACHAKMEKCPQCQGSLTNKIRNLFAEQLLEKYLPDCPWSKHGCTAKLHPTTGELHKIGCQHREVVCPASFCLKNISLRYVSGLGLDLCLKNKLFNSSNTDA